MLLSCDTGSPVRITNIPEPVSEGALAYTYCKWQGERKPIEGLGRPCSTGNSVHVMVMAAGGATLHGMVFYQRKGQPSYMDAKLERFPGIKAIETSWIYLLVLLPIAFPNAQLATMSLGLRDLI